MSVISTIINTDGTYDLFPYPCGRGYRSVGNDVAGPEGYYLHRPDGNLGRYVEATYDEAPIDIFEDMPTVYNWSKWSSKPSALLSNIFQELMPFAREMNGTFFVRANKYRRNAKDAWEISNMEYGFRAYDRATMVGFKLGKPNIKDLVESIKARGISY